MNRSFTFTKGRVSKRTPENIRIPEGTSRLFLAVESEMVKVWQLNVPVELASARLNGRVQTSAFHCAVLLKMRNSKLI